MRISFMICVFWVTTLIDAIPNDYELWLEPRSIGDMPIINWFYGSEPDKPKHEEIKQEVEPNHKETEPIVKDDEIKVIPVQEIEPGEKPKPIEDFLEELKDEADQSDERSRKKKFTLLQDLNKTMSESTTKLAKVFINNAWHLFDIGAYGTSRRTRNVQEVGYLMAPFYALLELFNKLIAGLNLSAVGNMAHLGNNSQGGGSLFDALFPFFSSNSYFGSPAHQNIIGGIAGSPGGHGLTKQSSGNNLYIICINDKAREQANNLLEGKTNKDMLSKAQLFLDQDDKELDSEKKFYITLKLHDLYDDLYGSNDEDELKLIKLILRIGEDPRFEQLFKIFKAKNDPDFDDIWELFKDSRPNLNQQYLTIIRGLPFDKIGEHPSRDCFVTRTNPMNKIMKDKNHKKDDEYGVKKSGMRKSKIQSRDLESGNEYHIFCIDDDDETKADHLFNGKSNDEVLDKINKKLEREDLSPEYRWYIILKLYKMLNRSDADKDDKNKIIHLMILIGQNPKFEGLLNGLKSKNDPRFREIWKIFKNEPTEPKKDDKPSPIKEKDHKDIADPPKVIEKIVNDLPSKEIKVLNPSSKVNGDPTSSGVTKIIEEIKEKQEPIHNTGTKIESPPPAQISEISNLVQTRLQPNNHSVFESETWTYNPSQGHFYNSKGKTLDSVLDEVEALMKNPATDLPTRWKAVDFINQMYKPNYLDERAKRRFDDLIRITKEKPEYDDVFNLIKKDKDQNESKRLFDLFGKDYKDPRYERKIETETYVVPPNKDDPNAPQVETRVFVSRSTSSNFHTQPGNLQHRDHASSYSPHAPTYSPPIFTKGQGQLPSKPKELDFDSLPAKLSLLDKTNAVINFFILKHLPTTQSDQKRILAEAEEKIDQNRQEFNVFEDVLFPQIPKHMDTIRVLNDFTDYLILTGFTQKGYTNGEEKMKAQEFVNAKLK